MSVSTIATWDSGQEDMTGQWTGQGKGQDGTGQRTRQSTEQRPGRRNHFSTRDEMGAFSNFNKYSANNIVRTGPAQQAQPDGMHYISFPRIKEMPDIV